MKKLLFIYLFIFSFCLSVSHSNNTGFAFLKIPPSAESIALGGINNTIINDASSLFINQSSLAFLNKHNLAINSIAFFSDINIHTLSYLYKGKIFNQGIGIKNLQTLSINRTEIEGQSPITNLGNASYYDRQIMYGISRKIDETSGVGIGISYYSQKLDNIKRNSFLFDIGYKKYYGKNFIHGISIKNLGQAIVFDKEKTSLPYTISTGIYYEKDWLPPLIFDIQWVKNDNIKFSVGTAINLEEHFHLYFSWQSDNDIKDSINLGISAFHNNYKISYAFKNFADFGDLHTFNVSIFFDKKEKVVKEIPDAPPLIDVNKNDLYFQFIQTGQRLYEDKKFYESIMYYEKAINIKPDFNIGIYKRIGDAYFQIKNYSEAEKYYDLYRKKLTE
jgi:tetratricopeptide (TPR) repeat protein